MGITGADTYAETAQVVLARVSVEMQTCASSLWVSFETMKECILEV